MVSLNLQRPPVESQASNNESISAPIMGIEANGSTDGECPVQSIEENKVHDGMQTDYSKGEAFERMQKHFRQKLGIL